jgi:hypothetical protein
MIPLFKKGNILINDSNSKIEIIDIKPGVELYFIAHLLENYKREKYTVSLSYTYVHKQYKLDLNFILKKL